MVKAREVVPGLYRLALGVVNAYLIVGETLVLIDTGVPGSEEKILAAIRELGRRPEQLSAIVVTHAHVDHTGSLAALKEATAGASAWMHPLDAELVREGRVVREVKPAPGFMNRLFYLAMRFVTPPEVAPTEVEHLINEGDVLFEGLRVHHIPGHCAGQIALVWPRHGGVLIAADAAANRAFPWQRGLSYPPIFEDLEEGRRSLAKLARLEVEVAVFGHGEPLVSGAGKRLGERFGGLAWA